MSSDLIEVIDYMSDVDSETDDTLPEMTTSQKRKRSDDISDVKPIALPGHIVKYNPSSNTYQQIPITKYLARTMWGCMRGNSKTRSHVFDDEAVRKNIISGLRTIASDYKCGCGRQSCDLHMTLFRKNKLSPDRQFDNLPYGHDKQIITFVCKEHNTTAKHDALPKERKAQETWYRVLGHRMYKNTIDRIDILMQKGDNMTTVEHKMVNQFEQNLNKSKEQYHELLLKLQKISHTCAECQTVLYFGDDRGILRLCVPNQVSADRIDDSNVFYENGNVRLVCASCNFIGNHNVRRFVRNACYNDGTTSELNAESLQDLIQHIGCQGMEPAQLECTKCKETKPVKCFDRGLKKSRRQCKDCRNARARECYAIRSGSNRAL
jgi:hypothetical protein